MPQAASGPSWRSGRTSGLRRPLPWRRYSGSRRGWDSSADRRSTPGSRAIPLCWVQGESGSAGGCHPLVQLLLEQLNLRFRLPGTLSHPPGPHSRTAGSGRGGRGALPVGSGALPGQRRRAQPAQARSQGGISQGGGGCADPQVGDTRQTGKGRYSAGGANHRIQEGPEPGTSHCQVAGAAAYPILGSSTSAVRSRPQNNRTNART
jgi:hypothetical protein